MHKNIRYLAYIVLACLAFLVIYIGFIPLYISHVQSQSKNGKAAWLNDPRLLKKMQEKQVGSIYDRRGELLAQTVTGPAGVNKRQYPMGHNFAHIIGYSSTKYGLTGIEAGLSSVLLGEGNLELSNPPEGNSIELTIDASLQKLAVSLLGGRRGALVAIEPKTGDILALASSPTFDPNEIDTQMPSLKNDNSSPLLNRATQGVYAPGSVFKLVTLTSVLQNIPGAANRVFECKGSLSGQGFVLKCNDVHGRIDLKEALEVSCNSVFAAFSLELGSRALIKTAQAYGFNRGCDLPINYYPGEVSGNGSMSESQLAFTAIGQGKAVANPMQMAIVACGLANNGMVMRPTLVKRIISPKGETIQESKPEEWLNVTDPDRAETIKDYMVAVVREGSGTRAGISGIEVAGKTGTAENSDMAHAWFVGFAPASDPEVAVAVIIENGGSGGAVAAPVAREIMSRAIDM